MGLLSPTQALRSWPDTIVAVPGKFMAATWPCHENVRECTQLGILQGLLGTSCSLQVLVLCTHSLIAVAPTGFFVAALIRC